jgi:hypothetical protein
MAEVGEGQKLATGDNWTISTSWQTQIVGNQGSSLADVTLQALHGVGNPEKGHRWFLAKSRISGI